MDFSAQHSEVRSVLGFSQYVSSCPIKLLETVSVRNGFVKYNQTCFLASLRMHVNCLLAALQKLSLLFPQLFS